MEYTYKPKRLSYGRRAYIGNYQGEEFFLIPIKWDCDWYFGGIYLEGLRATTEERLKESAYNIEMSDYYNVKDIPFQYLNEDKFKQDMVDEWGERAEIQERQDRNGEEVLLTFGTHTHADSVLLDKCKGDYKTALNVFDKLYIKEDDFIKFIEILKEFYKNKEGKINKGYLKRMDKQESLLQEYEQFIQKFPELPPEEFWTECD